MDTSKRTGRKLSTVPDMQAGLETMLDIVSERVDEAQRPKVASLKPAHHRLICGLDPSALSKQPTDLLEHLEEDIEHVCERARSYPPALDAFANFNQFELVMLYANVTKVAGQLNLAGISFDADHLSEVSRVTSSKIYSRASDAKKKKRPGQLVPEHPDEQHAAEARFRFKCPNFPTLSKSFLTEFAHQVATTVVEKKKTQGKKRTSSQAADVHEPHPTVGEGLSQGFVHHDQTTAPLRTHGLVGVAANDSDSEFASKRGNVDFHGSDDLDAFDQDLRRLWEEGLAMPPADLSIDLQADPPADMHEVEAALDRVPNSQDRELLRRTLRQMHEVISLRLYQPATA